MPNAQRLSDDELQWLAGNDTLMSAGPGTRVPVRVGDIANEALLRGLERDRAQHRHAVTEGERNLAEAAVKTNYDLLQRAEAKVAALKVALEAIRTNGGCGQYNAACEQAAGIAIDALNETP